MCEVDLNEAELCEANFLVRMSTIRLAFLLAPIFFTIVPSFFYTQSNIHANGGVSLFKNCGIGSHKKLDRQNLAKVARTL